MSQLPSPPVTPPPTGRPARHPMLKAVAVWTLVAAGVGLVIFFIAVTWSPDKDVTPRSYSEFLTDVRSDLVDTVTIDSASGAISGTYKSGKLLTSRGPAGSLPAEDLATLDAHGVSRQYNAPPSDFGWLGSLLGLLLPMVLIVGVILWFGRRAARGGGAAGAAAFGQNPGHVYTTERPATTFADVAGYDAVKDDIREVVEFLRDPGRFREIGARIPKGVLLVGPPGTGKTLMARAVAGEAGVAFISVTGSHFMEMFVGVGAARVRGLFDAARQHAPSIIFVDEIDSIGRTRGSGAMSGGHDERDQTLNQLLTELDGFEGRPGEGSGPG